MPRSAEFRVMDSQRWVAEHKTTSQWCGFDAEPQPEMSFQSPTLVSTSKQPRRRRGNPLTSGKTLQANPIYSWQFGATNLSPWPFPNNQYSRPYHVPRPRVTTHISSVHSPTPTQALSPPRYLADQDIPGMLLRLWNQPTNKPMKQRLSEALRVCTATTTTNDQRAQFSRNPAPPSCLQERFQHAQQSLSVRPQHRHGRLHDPAVHALEAA